MERTSCITIRRESTKKSFTKAEKNLIFERSWTKLCVLMKRSVSTDVLMRDAISWDPTPRQNECAGLSHARIVSTREGLVSIKFAIETTARQNGGNLNSLCLFSFCDDKDNTTLIRFKF